MRVRLPLGAPLKTMNSLLLQQIKSAAFALIDAGHKKVAFFDIRYHIKEVERWADSVKIIVLWANWRETGVTSTCFLRKGRF